jgi:hypothetical protein
VKKVKRKLSVLIVPLFFLGIMFLGTTPVTAAESLNGVSSARVGVIWSFTADGLTSGSIYLVEAAHSGGNQSVVLTATGSSETEEFIFESEDSDGVVPIQIYAATNLGAKTGNPLATFLLNLDAADEGLSTAFFVGILGGLLVIVIIVRVVRNLINST